MAKRSGPGNSRRRSQAKRPSAPAGSSASSPHQVREIPDEQWTLPVTFDHDGHMVTLRQVQEGHDYLDPAQLTQQQRFELTVARIERKHEFLWLAISAGRIDKRRALAEVHARSPLGHDLVEIEFYVIVDLMNLVLPNVS